MVLLLPTGGLKCHPPYLLRRFLKGLTKTSEKTRAFVILRSRMRRRIPSKFILIVGAYSRWGVALTPALSVTHPPYSLPSPIRTCTKGSDRSSL